MSRQTKHKVEVNSITIKTSIVATKVEKNCKKNVATLKIMSRHTEKLKVEIFVMTMIQKFLNHKVAILLSMLQ